jgi:hypothetical protein
MITSSCDTHVAEHKKLRFVIGHVTIINFRATFENVGNTANSMVAEPEDSTTLIPNPTTGHDPNLAPSSPCSRNLFP